MSLELPNQWLWEIIDEFIYQFQSFQQFRAKLHKKSEEEVMMILRVTVRLVCSFEDLHSTSTRVISLCST